MSERLVFECVIYGEAQPAGSKRGFKRGDHVVVVDANPKAQEWKNLVALVAGSKRRDAEGQPLPLLEEPLALEVDFYRVRPKGHFGKKGLRPSAPRYPTTRPDRTKLLRGVEDALTGIVWRDDSQIVDGPVRKRFAEQAYCHIRVYSLAEVEIDD